MNTEFRKQAKSDFENKKNFCMCMNDSVSLIKILRNRLDIRQGHRTKIISKMHSNRQKNLQENADNSYLLGEKRCSALPG